MMIWRRLQGDRAWHSAAAALATCSHKIAGHWQCKANMCDSVCLCDITDNMHNCHVSPTRCQQGSWSAHTHTWTHTETHTKMCDPTLVMWTKTKRLRGKVLFVLQENVPLMFVTVRDSDSGISRGGGGGGSLLVTLRQKLPVISKHLIGRHLCPLERSGHVFVSQMSALRSDVSSWQQRWQTAGGISWLNARSLLAPLFALCGSN